MTSSPNSQLSLTGKTAIVTGALGFLGKFFSAGLAEAGANVVVTDLNREECEKFAVVLEERYKIQSMGISCNVTDPESVKHMTEKVRKNFLNIDILLNNAAYSSKDLDSLCAPFEEYLLETWKRMIDVNVNGVFLCSQAIGSVMVEQGRGGSIILVSSIYGILGTDHRIYEKSNLLKGRTNNPSSYSTTKGAIIAFARYLATYWADKKIRVNTLSPGGVENNQDDAFINEYSNRVPMGRMARPEELIGALIYLASDASSYVTGQNIVVDGGLSAW